MRTNPAQNRCGNLASTLKRVLLLAWCVTTPADLLATDVRFEFVDRFAKSVDVEIAPVDGGSASSCKLTHVGFGIWQGGQELPAGSYRYRFVLDGGEAVSDISRKEFIRRDDGSVWSPMDLSEGQEAFSNVQQKNAAQEARALYSSTLRLVKPEAASVAVAGEFNQWALTPLRRLHDGTWRVDIQAPVGEYGYKFVVDDRWEMDPAASAVKVVNGTTNSLLKVSEASVALPAEDGVAFDPLAMKSQVTFRYHDPLAQRVSVVGTFNGWNGEQNQMVQLDGVWTCVIPLPGGTYEYKFKADDTWIPDPNNIHQGSQASGGNSILVVSGQPDGSESSDLPLFDPEAWRDAREILLEPAAPWHPFSQELLRAYLYVIATARHRLPVADGSLLKPDRVPGQAPARWGWSVRSDAGTPMAVVSASNKVVSLALSHPILGTPQSWLTTLRKQASQLWADPSLPLTGPTSPPPGSAWAEALSVIENPVMLGNAFAVNKLTEFGRREGWSPELLRDLASTYADLANDLRFPSMGGWDVNVYAARAVVYADLARGTNEVDETMAYVLCRVGRPDDAIAFMPEQCVTWRGQLASAMARCELEEFRAWVGTPDRLGFEIPRGMTSVKARPNSFTRHEKATALRAMSDLLLGDEQLNQSRLYLDAALRLEPGNFSARVKALERGSVSAGHLHASTLLRTASCFELWTNVFAGGRPSDCAVDQEAANRIEADAELERQVNAVSAFYKEKQREVLDSVADAIPESARIGLLRDHLNVAWWHNARFFGQLLSWKEGCLHVHRVMTPWKPMHQEMESFTRFLLKGALDDHSYTAIKQGLLNSEREPDTLAYVRLVKSSFRTWLFDKAQSFYPRAPYLVSDLWQDYQIAEPIYVFKNMDYQRAQYRRLASRYSEGYPYEGAATVSASLTNSFGINRRLAEAANTKFDAASQEATRTFYKRCIAAAPFETGVYRDLGDVLLDSGDAQGALDLARSFPDSTEGLELASMKRLSAFASLELGNLSDALGVARSSARSGQAWSMTVYAHLLELAGQDRECLQVLGDESRRYDSHAEFYYLVRRKPDEAPASVEQTLSWIEQFPDLSAASRERRFSFNEFKDHPFYYASLGRWDKSLWLLKPLCEAVQNDYMWFMLLTVGQKTQDQAAVDLAIHVLANHVQNVFGEHARFMRGDRTWSDVLNAARIEGKPQPVYVLAGIVAEQRGDKALARRLYQHALNPRFGLAGWYTMAWNGLKETGGDPAAFVARAIDDKQPERDM